MTSAADDFESLFDEVAAQRVETQPAAPAPVPVVAATLAPAADAHTDAEPVSEKHMFERLGGITRILHDSLRELGLDRTLTDAHGQIRDSQDRLEYIASLTEQAANKTLNAIDVGMPAQDQLALSAKSIEGRWDALFEGKLSLEEFKSLAGDSKQFAAMVTESTEAEKARLLEIMMAQDFQDITGQLIKKIVVITKQLEHELAQLLRDNAPPEAKAAMAAAAAKPVELMHGPSVPAAAMEQDDVDSLLADLGF